MKANILLEELRRLAQRKSDVIPPGWKTARQLAKEWGVSRWMARSFIIAGVENGKLAKQVFRVKLGEYPKPVAHYAVKKKSKS